MSRTHAIKNINFYTRLFNINRFRYIKKTSLNYYLIFIFILGDSYSRYWFIFTVTFKSKLITFNILSRNTVKITTKQVQPWLTINLTLITTTQKGNKVFEFRYRYGKCSFLFLLSYLNLNKLIIIFFLTDMVWNKCTSITIGIIPILNDNKYNDFNEMKEWYHWTNSN